MRTFEYIITPNEYFEKRSIYDYLIRCHGFSRRVIKRLKQTEDGILLNGKHARVIDYLCINDVLTINLEDQDKKEIIISEDPADVVYEDDDIVVLNKPPFMPVHQSKKHQSDTLANAFAAYYTNKGEPVPVFRPINRLDRDTSGLVAVAKNAHTATILGNHIEKEYIAIVCGSLKDDYGTINAPIDRVDEVDIKRYVSETGQEAVTHYRVIARNEEYTAVACSLETGRTHQIRVHFAHMGYPLLGDVMYGKASDLIDRQALHCAMLCFKTAKDKKAKTVLCQMSKDILFACDKIGLYIDNV